MAIEAGAARFLEIAGNIIDRAYGAGIVANGAWGQNPLREEIPFLRSFIHHNKITNCLLHTSDWGGIDIYRVGGAVYNNIVYNPVGQWFWSYRQHEKIRKDSTKPPTVETLGMAYYLNGPGAMNYCLFNNVAWGRTTDANDPAVNYLGLMSAKPLNSFVNNTVYNFTCGALLTRNNVPCLLGNLFVDTTTAIKTDLKHDEPEAFARSHWNGTIIARNMAIGQVGLVWRFVDYVPLVTIDNVRSYLAPFQPVDGSIGLQVAKAPSFRNAGAGDFRLVPGSPAIGAGVRPFLPWRLMYEVGVWRFHADPSDPKRIRDEHFLITEEWPARLDRDEQARHDLVWQGDSAMKFVPGPLEDWTDSALALDGKAGFCAIGQPQLQKEIKDEKTGKVLVAGTARRTADMGENNFLVEAYFSTAAGQKSGVIVSKGNGYSLDLDPAGNPRFSLQGADAKGSRAAAVAVNDGQWYHVIAEADRSDAQGIHLYVDGKLCDGAWTGAMPKGSLQNADDLVVGKGVSGAIAFLRISQGTLRDAETTIGELYAWEFDGPFLRDFMGVKPVGKRDAGAFQHAD